MKNPAVPTAATELLPAFPTHIISIILYAICINEVAIIGSDSFTNFSVIFPCVKSILPFIISPLIIFINIYIIDSYIL